MTRAKLASPSSAIGLYCGVVSTFDLPSLHQGASLWVAVPRVETLGLNPISANLIKASARQMYLSQRDSMIVARHEVPGVMREMAPSQRDD